MLSLSSLSPEIIENANLLLNNIHNKTVQTLVKWHLSLFLKIFSFCICNIIR